MNWQQTTFDGGINQIDDDSRIGANQYRLLINARSRFGRVQPIRQSVRVSGLLDGNLQGAIAVGNTLIAFVSGRAYYRIYGTNTWIRIANFLMDPVANRVWAIAVPKSTRDYVRKRNNSLNNPIIINTDFNIAGNPAGIVVQDGLTQPWLIEFNATSQTFIARQCKTYEQWSNVSVTANDREYVPIGKQMFFLNQKLYIVAPDGKSIYHSVTGRPLDFMVNVDANGNKLPSESAGGAASVSFSFDNDVITHVQPVNITDSFMYATARHVRLLTLDYDYTILGEPTYRQAQIIEAGIVNDQAAVEILGDYAFIDNDGIKSFNAVANFRVEGRNTIMSLQLAKLLNARVQKASIAAAVTFDNYALFYCQTNLGNGICVYDMLRQSWSSIDITSVQNIKQFVVLANGLDYELFAVTNKGLYQMYAATTRETAQLHLRALMPDDLKNEHKGFYVKPLFRGATTPGMLQIIEYADEQFSARQVRNQPASVMAMTFPMFFPLGFDDKPNARNEAVIFDKNLGGKKLAYVILWNTDAELHSVKIETSEYEAVASSRQGAST